MNLPERMRAWRGSYVTTVKPRVTSVSHLPDSPALDLADRSAMRNRVFCPRTKIIPSEIAGVAIITSYFEHHFDNLEPLLAAAKNSSF